MRPRPWKGPATWLLAKTNPHLMLTAVVAANLIGCAPTGARSWRTASFCGPRPPVGFDSRYGCCRWADRHPQDSGSRPPNGPGCIRWLWLSPIHPGPGCAGARATAAAFRRQALRVVAAAAVGPRGRASALGVRAHTARHCHACTVYSSLGSRW